MNASQGRVFKRTASIYFLALTLLVLSACDSNRKYLVKNIPVGNGRSISILADEMAEITPGVYYQVKVGEETVVPTCLKFNAAKDPDSLSFKIVSASGGNLIGVYEASQPERILVLHDFSKGITWPRGSPHKSDWDNDTAGGKLLEELQKDHPDKKFKLDRGAAWGVER